MSDFRQLQTFVEVVKQGSLSAAARQQGTQHLHHEDQQAGPGHAAPVLLDHGAHAGTLQVQAENGRDHHGGEHGGFEAGK